MNQRATKLPEAPEHDADDEERDDGRKEDSNDDGEDMQDVATLASIGLACAVTVGLVLVIGLWIVRLRRRQRPSSPRDRANSERTDSSSVADNDVVDRDFLRDVPPSYSDAVRLPQPRLGLEMTVWSISGNNVEHGSPPPAYADIVEFPVGPSHQGRAGNSNASAGSSSSPTERPSYVVDEAQAQTGGSGNRMVTGMARSCDVAPVHGTHGFMWQVRVEGSTSSHSQRQTSGCEATSRLPEQSRVSSSAVPLQRQSSTFCSAT